MGDTVAEQIEVVEAVESEPEKAELRLVALNPLELRESQSQLIAWAESRLAAEKADLAEIEQNLAVAKKSKWNTAGFRNQKRNCETRIAYYSKIHAALAAGYFIVPNMPMAVFAVRTTAAGPRGEATSRYNEHDAAANLPAVRPSYGAGVGEGEYVGPRPEAGTWDDKDSEGKDVYHAVAEGFQTEIAFPFAIVKPAILGETERAMAMRIFDRIGVVDANDAVSRKGDPMIVGQIVRRVGYSEKATTFLIAWFLDTKDL